MVDKNWWQRPLRIIQYNLQVKDTPKMKAVKIAEDLKELDANAVVLNVGGIYAWYPSKIQYHHINEYLPEDQDLLKNLIEECHKQGVKVIARFDFSKTDDYVYLQKPGWFVSDTEKKPLIYGKERMGEWSQLITTCVNGGYRNEELAMPVIEEVLHNYEIDGIFFNAPQMEECHCGNCRRKYRERYGKVLPDRKEEFETDWTEQCLRDNIGNLYSLVKNIRKEVPVILYYSTFEEGRNNRVDNLDHRYETADLICTEAQDVLSKGAKKIPQAFKPALNMKLGNSVENKPLPCGIIHSSPGMDWRHTGITPAEYLYWMSQVPANRGIIWHSLTGFNDTISDKRILKSVGQINHNIKKCEVYMEDAVSVSQVVLLWNGSEAAMGWAEAMINIQCQFDLLDKFHFNLDKLKEYAVLVIPGDFELDEDTAELLQEYIDFGGKVILESIAETQTDWIPKLAGLKPVMSASSYLTASYIRFEPEGAVLKNKLEEVELLPHRGRVLYVEPENFTKTLLTLVPPFAPLDGVGAPPERASMCVSHTELPLCTLKRTGKGALLFLPFELSKLALEFKFSEYYQLMKNCLDYMLGENQVFSMDNSTELSYAGGLQAMVYSKEGKRMIHLVNGIGQRPLTNTIPCYNIKFRVKKGNGDRVSEVISVIGQEEVDWEEKKDYVYITLRRLDVWDMILIQ
ncbi:family 10 glycosylhydrolase [Anaerocolumna sp. AGMB13025]|uniref:family 10 glycosylhydrolase n=1 Tax=Anaerocolumna sp. AGMB13025 TaxID=3039116 RepID=UPI00241F981F|nr:family 10 glycosylhydrolase [Anaerocolumna sp. AGMB13025]WFR59461.1 family 10 glycosylhydrolase [Anaerocolumna sp. AGMB13025]